MADVRGLPGIPPLLAFGGALRPTPSTPLVINTNTGDGYVNILGTVQRVFNGSASATLTATGTNQATALELTAGVNLVSTVAAGTGVKLNSAVSAGGAPQVVYNGGANVLTIYPDTGSKINEFATNAGIPLNVRTSVIFWRASSTRWIGMLSA